MSSLFILVKLLATTGLIKLAGIVCGLLLHLVSSRILGASGYGVVSYTLSWTMIVVLLAQFGTPRVCVKYISDFDNKHTIVSPIHIVKYSYLIVTIACVFLAILILLISNTSIVEYIPGKNEVIPSSIIIIISLAFVGIARGALQGLKAPVRSLVPGGIIRPLLAVSIISFYSHYSSIQIAAHDAIFFIALASICSAFVSFFLLHNKLRDIKSFQYFDKCRDHKKIFSISIAFLIIALLETTNKEIDIIVVGLLVEQNLLGLFSASKKISELVLFTLITANVFIAPYIISAINDRNVMQTLVWKCSSLIFLSTLFIGSVVFYYPEWFLKLFGEEYRYAGSALRILVTGAIIRGSLGPVQIILAMCGLHSSLIIIYCITIFLTILLSLILIPVYGLNGAALATSISLVISFVLMSLTIFIRLGINPTVFNKQLLSIPYNRIT